MAKYRDRKQLMAELRDRLGEGLTTAMVEAQWNIRKFTPVYSGSLLASNNVSQGIPDLSIIPPQYDESGSPIPESVPEPPLWQGDILFETGAGDIYLSNNLPYAEHIYLLDGSRKLRNYVYTNFVEQNIPQILERNLTQALLGF